MDQRKRRKLLQEKLSQTCLPQGFKHYSGEYFVRDRGDIQDVFFFQQTRGNGQYYIAYGIDCPQLLSPLRNNDVLKLGNLPRLLIDNGRLEDGRAYGCKYEDHIDSSAVKVAAALEIEAEAWFSRYNTINEVIEQYRALNIGSESPSENVPPGKIIRWCQYGLMLLEVGNATGHQWLKPVLATYKSRPKATEQDKEWVKIIEDCYP